MVPTTVYYRSGGSPSVWTDSNTTDCYNDFYNGWQNNRWVSYIDYPPETTSRIDRGRRYNLPDGAELIIDELGNYKIEDKHAKITYAANNNRDFSPYLNASDMLAQFVSYIGKLGVPQKDVLSLPIHLFVSWLIIEAAERDGDPIPEDIIPIDEEPEIQLAVKPKCRTCGRYIKRLHLRHGFPYCNPAHASKYLEISMST